MVKRILPVSLAVAVVVCSSAQAEPALTSWFRGAGVTADFRGDTPGGAVFIYAVADEYLARANVEPKEYFLAGTSIYGFYLEAATGKQYYFWESSNAVVFKRAGSHYEASASLPVRWCVYSYPDPPTDCIDDTVTLRMDVIALEKEGFQESVTMRRELPNGPKFWENREQSRMPVVAGDTYVDSAVLGRIPVNGASASLGKGKIVMHN